MFLSVEETSQIQNEVKFASPSLWSNYGSNLDLFGRAEKSKKSLLKFFQ